MKSIWGFGSLAALSLVLLSLCSTGDSLECYNCQTFTSECKMTTTCPGDQNACLRLTLDQQSRHQCFAYSNCSPEKIKASFGVTNFDYKCCQSNLCNNSFTTLPSAGLLLSLAAALVLIFTY
ncbi:CD59 glycoprotein [Rhinophrynus dorsalis]